jgi:hypothetical protein
MLADEKSVGEYVKAHSNEAGGPPGAAVNERFNVVEPPGLAEPDARERERPCARPTLERPKMKKRQVQLLKMYERISPATRAFDTEVARTRTFSLAYYG